MTVSLEPGAAKTLVMKMEVVMRMMMMSPAGLGGEDPLLIGCCELPYVFICSLRLIDILMQASPIIIIQ